MAVKNPQPSPTLVADYDLWVLPQAAHSRWFSRIDWYLNWQMTKGLAHQPLKASVELLRVMEETGVQFTAEFVTNATPLMVASLGRVNASQCVVIDFEDKLKPWLGKIHQLSSGLKPKRMRVFLPQGCDSKPAQEIWQKLSLPGTEVEFSLDEAAT